MKLVAAGSIALAMLASGCSDKFEELPPRVSIQLTAAEAASLNDAIRSIALNTPDLSGLIDSTNLVLRAGAVIDSTDIDVSFGGGTYYAVSLQRAVTYPTSAFSTFHAIYFNSPSNPTRVVIVSVWARGSVGPPDGVLANLATPTPVLVPYVHFYQIDGQNVTHWKASEGSLVLGNSLPGGACPAFTADGAIACENAELLVGANVTASIRESGTAPGTPTLSVANGFVRGIKLKFTFF
jgi:hypothetical protein